MSCHVMWCDVVSCHIMPCHLMGCDGMRCDCMLCGCDAMRCSMWSVVSHLMWCDVAVRCATNYTPMHGETLGCKAHKTIQSDMSQYHDPVIQSTKLRTGTDYNVTQTTEYYDVLQSTTAYSLIRTTKYYSTTPYYKVLLCTTRHC